MDHILHIGNEGTPLGDLEPIIQIDHHFKILRLFSSSSLFFSKICAVFAIGHAQRCRIFRPAGKRALINKPSCIEEWKQILFFRREKKSYKRRQSSIRSFGSGWTIDHLIQKNIKTWISPHSSVQEFFYTSCLIEKAYS